MRATLRGSPVCDTRALAEQMEQLHLAAWKRRIATRE
jgi:hypothetical protein